MKKNYLSPIINISLIFDRQDVLVASTGTVSDCYGNLNDVAEFFGGDW